MTFIPGLHPLHDQDQQILWFIFDKSKLLVKSAQDSYALPEADGLAENGFTPAVRLYLGVLRDQPCYAARLNPGDPLPANCEWMDLRALVGLISDELFRIAGRANHLLDWDLTHQYCAAHTRQIRKRAKICPACNMINYPRLSPAVIMAVVRDDRILLARNKRFRASFHSVLAGFVEPGETLEECVQREIKEEVGLDIMNIRKTKNIRKETKYSLLN
jgi:NAD+ diphosphatase